MKELQKRLQTFAEQSIADGMERGLQIVVYRDGELLADVVAGEADSRAEKPVREKTLFPVFSVTKGLTATAIHQLAQAGKLDYETSVADYWPEFGINGKKAISLRQVLDHTAGVPYLPPGVSEADVTDWDYMCGIVANLTPVTPPGSKTEYHPVTYGWILGEVIRRVDGRTFPDYLREEISDPLGVDDDMFVSLPEGKEDSVAWLEDVGIGPDWSRPEEAFRGVPVAMEPLSYWMNRPAARQAFQPASSGMMSARAIARHYAALLPGGVDGLELLSPLTVAEAALASYGSQSDPAAATHGLGYQLLEPIVPGSTRGFGHGGHGGSVGFADPSTGLAVGLTKNLFGKQDTRALVREELQRMRNLG